MVNATHAPVAETVQPSAAHVALVELFSGMLEAFAGTSHPLVNLVKRLQPSLNRDLATVPEDTLRKAARDYADAFAHIASAGVPLSPSPDLVNAGAPAAVGAKPSVPEAPAPIESEPASEMV